MTLEFKARRLRPGSVCWIGVPCSTWVFLCLVHYNGYCWVYNGFCFYTLDLNWLRSCNIRGLTCGGLPIWCVCVSTNLLKFDYTWNVAVDVWYKNNKEPWLNASQLVQIWRTSLWYSSVFRFISIIWFVCPFLDCLPHAGNTDFFSVFSANRLARRIAYLWTSCM